LRLQNFQCGLTTPGTKKDPTFSATIERCDGPHYSKPEYNHGYPGLLKHALDMTEGHSKAVAFGGGLGGTVLGARAIEALLPVMRELGLVTFFWDMNFETWKSFSMSKEKFARPSYVRRLDKFLNELDLGWRAFFATGEKNIPEVKTE